MTTLNQRMTSLNQRLAIVAVVLMALSILVYWNGVSSADRFETGQKLLPNLDPDEIGDITVLQGEESLTLERDAGSSVKDEYRVAEKAGYRAKNEAINRLVRTLLDATLAREVGAGAELDEEFGIEPMSEDTVEITIENQSGQEMVRLRVGGQPEDGSGRYVRRLDVEDAPIYLTEGRLTIDTEAGQYLRQEIVDVARGDIVRIEGPDFVIARGEDENAELELQDVPPGREEKTSETGRVEGGFARLAFDDVFLADDPEVAGLEFRPALRVSLDDQSGYATEVAQKDERVFLRIGAFFDIDRIEVTQEETDEELKEKSQVLKRADEVQQFNSYHGSWVYELSDFVGEKFLLTKPELVEDS
jgi:hypothetical protein